MTALLKKIADRQQQIDAFQKNVSYRESTRVESLDKEGKVEFAQVTVTRVTVKDGKMERVVESTHKEGDAGDTHVDIQIGGDSGGKGGKGDKDISMGSPFDADQQAKQKFTVVGPVPEAPGKLRIRFEPAGDREGASVGDAVVDPETGDLASLSFGPAKLPTFVDRLTITIVFGCKSPVGLLPTSIDMYGAGGILLIKKRMRTHTELSQYVLTNP